MVSYVKPGPDPRSDPAKSPRTAALTGVVRIKAFRFHQHSASPRGSRGRTHGAATLPETQPPPAERRVAASSRHSGRGQSKRASRRTPSPLAGRSGPSRPHSVLRDPTLPCAKDTSVGSARPFYATVAPLYDPCRVPSGCHGGRRRVGRSCLQNWGKSLKQRKKWLNQEVAQPGWLEVVGK